MSCTTKVANVRQGTGMVPYVVYPWPQSLQCKRTEKSVLIYVRKCLRMYVYSHQLKESKDKNYKN